MLVKMAMRSGQNIPERIANSPKIKAGYNFYLECFYDLIDDVSWKSIVSYGNYYNLDYSTIEDLLLILPRLQSEYNKLRAKFRNE